MVVTARGTVVEEKDGVPPRRISRVVLEVCKYVSYMRIEFSDGSEAFTAGRSEQSAQQHHAPLGGSARNFDDITHALSTSGSSPSASYLSSSSSSSSSYSTFTALPSTHDTAPIKISPSKGRKSTLQQLQQQYQRPELSSSYKYRLLLQQQQRLGSRGGLVEIDYVLLRETLTLESSEVIVDVWGHLFPGTTLVSSIAFYTSKERIFGPYGITEGDPFDLAAPDGGCYLYALRASCRRHRDAAVLGGLAPTWCRARSSNGNSNGEGAIPAYKPREVAVVGRRIRDIIAYQESVAAFVSHSVSGTEVSARLVIELRLDARRQKQQQQRGRGRHAEPWPVTCFALVEEADLMVEDIRASYPRLVAEDADVARGLEKIAAFSQSLREIARGHAASVAISRALEASAPTSLAPSSASSIQQQQQPSSQQTPPRDVPKAAFYLVPEGGRQGALTVERGLCIPGARLVVAPFRHGDPAQLFAFTREGLIVSRDSGMAVCAVVAPGLPFTPGAVAVMDEAATETCRDMDREHVLANFARQSFSYFSQDHTFRIGDPAGAQVLCLAMGPAVPGTQGEQRFVVLAAHTGELGQRWLFKR